MNALGAALVLVVLAACGGGEESTVSSLDEGAPYTVEVTAADFVSGIDNPWLPLTPGSRWVYQATDGEEVETTEVTVLAETKTINGITATVVRDTVRVDGELIEDTFDWYAQDREGNVWYLGEDTAEYENGAVVSTAGAWEAWVDGALPGIIMMAQPTVGAVYRQEYYPGEAEDMAEVTGTTGSQSVPFGSFVDLLVTREWSPLDPGVVEEKYYAAGFGKVVEVMVEGGTLRTELVEYQPGV